MMMTIKSLKGLGLKFWHLNLVQMLERLAYWVTVLQIPIYIAQKDIEGGLAFEQTLKGVIFFWWAIVQNLSPVFWGAVSDRIGRKKSMLFSSLVIIAGFILLGNVRDFLPFLLSTLLLGFGLGTFKPALLGWLSVVIPNEKSSIGWGIFVFLVNFAVFFGPPIAIFLKSISWTWVFYGSASIFILNFILILTLREEPNEINSERINLKNYLRTLGSAFKRIDLVLFVFIMSGFTMTYMQFYETLPNFIYDWADTSAIASVLPKFMTSETPRGLMVSYEWLYNINAGLIILFVIPVAFLSKRIKISQSLALGIFLAGFGLMISGFTNSGILLIIGITVYTFGEIVINPKFNEFISKIAPNEDKSLYMGIMNISWAIGLSGGGLIGGWIYHNFGEKSGFALRLLETKGINGVASTDAVARAMEVTGMNANQITNYLWNTYNPHVIWIPFGVVSMISFLAMLAYSKNNKNAY